MAPKPKPKAKPQPQPTPAAPLEDLFSALHRHANNLSYDQAVKVADQVLAAAPGDEDALRCKVVALIKADYIDRALDVVAEFEGGAVDFGFYKAYCLYRKNKLSEALECLKSQENNPIVLQLESQILYRLGKMDDCIVSYEKLQNFKMDSLDVKTNMIAALVSSGRSSEVQKLMDSTRVKATSTFEMAYNTACSLIERKKYTDAEQLLLASRRIGQETLMEDDFADDEIENELSPIAVQLAYVQQLLGHVPEALEVYNDIVNKNIVDASSLAVATNNLIALKGTKDVSDGLKKLDRLIEKTAGTPPFRLANNLDLKFLARQKEAIYSNRMLLLLHANKLDQGEELASALLTMFPESMTPVLLQAAVLVRGKKIPKAEEVLNQFAEKYPNKSRSALLARAQIAAAAGHFNISADSLSKIPDIQHLPATVATIVSLRERSGDLSGAFAVLDSAVQWWKNSMSDGDTAKLDTIMHEAASFKLSHGNDKGAAQLYEEIVKSHKSVKALVGLVTTTASTDIGKAESYEKQLKPLPGLKGVNVDALEKTSGAKPVDSAYAKKMEVVEEVKEKTKAKKKRKRKPKYPKGFDPANPGPPPDPERWLPRRERSSYRPKRKDKRNQVRGSQGAVVRERHDTTTASNPNGASSSTANPKAAQSTASSSKASTQKSKGSSKSRKKSRS